MIQFPMLKRTTLFIFLLFACHAFASIDVYNFVDEEKRADFVSLTKELRCPKCQNQDIADSNAPIAADMRKEVHRLLGEGKDKDSIVAYMVDRFGEFVTYKPKKTTETYMLWYGPWVLICVGVVVIVSLVRLNKKSNTVSASVSDDVQSLLKKYDRDNETNE